MNRRNFLLGAAALLTAGVLDKSLAFAAKNNVVSLDELKKLAAGNELVVAYNNGKVKIYNDRGIKPLFDHLEHNDFKNAYVYDKITGKASALLLAYGKAERLYTHTLSKKAIPILEKYNIEYSADRVVDFIENRKKTGSCPMEIASENIDNPKIAYKVLKEKLKELPGK